MAGYSTSESSSSGSSSGSSQSTSTPISVTSPQSDWGLMQSKLLDALGDKVFNWAMDQYAKGEGVTDQTIQNFMEMSGRAKGLADTLLHQYSDVIKPLMDQYIRDAGSYASEGRQRFEAGQAESAVARASQAGMNEIERRLESQGINVNSGRIQSQLMAARIQDAAARAGAGTKAAQDTEATGRQMTENALRMGQQIPGQAMGAIQSAYAGLSGAESAILGLMNSADKLAQTAVPYKSAAVAANKIPPVGQNAQSSSVQSSSQRSQSQQYSEQTDPPQRPQQQQPRGRGEGEGGERGGGTPGGGQRGGGGPGGGMGGGGGPAAKRPETPILPPKIIDFPKPEEDEKTGTGAAAEPGYNAPIPYTDPQTGELLPQWQPETFDEGKALGPDTSQWRGEQVNNWTLPEQYGAGTGFNMGIPGENPIPANSYLLGGLGDPYSTGVPTTWDDIDEMAGQTPAASSPNSGTGYDPWGSQDFSSYDEGVYPGSEYGMDNVSMPSYEEDYYGSENVSMPSYEYGMENVDMPSYEEDYYGSENVSMPSYEEDYYGSENVSMPSYEEDYYGSENVSMPSYEEPYYGSENVSMPSYEEDYYEEPYYSYSGGEENYARGGRVRPRPMRRGVLPTTGGAVSRNASPSRGRRTDDIPARLNAGEYVIPRDVVAHKGTEFFTKMIQNSRKLRTGNAGATPRPTMKPAMPAGQRPAFRSRPMQLPSR